MIHQVPTVVVKVSIIQAMRQTGTERDSGVKVIRFYYNLCSNCKTYGIQRNNEKKKRKREKFSGMEKGINTVQGADDKLGQTLWTHSKQ